MPDTAVRMKATDLLVHGTFALRCALSAHDPVPLEPLPEPAGKPRHERRPAVAAGEGRPRE